MNDRPGGGTDIAEGVNMGHHVMPQFFFVACRGRKIDVVDLGPQFGDLRFFDRQTQLPFRLGQRHPQPPPSAELPLVTP